MYVKARFATHPVSKPAAGFEASWPASKWAGQIHNQCKVMACSETGWLDGSETGRVDGFETGRVDGSETGWVDGFETGWVDGFETSWVDDLETSWWTLTR